MTKKPTSSFRLVCQNLQFFPILFSIVFSFFGTTSITAQSKEQLIGYWQLQKVRFKKSIVMQSGNDEKEMLLLFQSALLNTLEKEEQLVIDELEIINTKAKELADIFNQSNIEFQANGAYYNNTKSLTFSGEFTLDDKKLMLEWATGDTTKLKVLKNTSTELVLKDAELKIRYYYIKIKQ